MRLQKPKAEVAVAAVTIVVEIAAVVVEIAVVVVEIAVVVVEIVAVVAEVTKVVTIVVEIAVVVVVNATVVVEIVAVVAEIVAKEVKEATMGVHLVENTKAAMIEDHNAVTHANPVDGVPKTSVGRVVAEIRRGVFI